MGDDDPRVTGLRVETVENAVSDVLRSKPSSAGDKLLSHLFEKVCHLSIPAGFRPNVRHTCVIIRSKIRPGAAKLRPRD